MASRMTPPELVFPPLMWGEEADGDAMDHASARAIVGCDAGLVSYHLDPMTMQAALVFAPEVPLAKAMVMLPLCGVGFQNALGVLAPPEVSVHLQWDGGILVNGAGCGRMRARAATRNPEEIPEWLVVGFDLPLMPPDDDPGKTPDQTALFAEGCAGVEPPMLVEAWARHTLNWVNRWEADGTRPLHNEWRGLAHGIGEDTHQAGKPGTYMGIDEDFGMLLRVDETTELVPLWTVLEDSP